MRPSTGQVVGHAARQFAAVAFAAALALLPGCIGKSAPKGPPDALADACRWLWDQQQPDGSWRSARYAVLKSGQAMTPFVLHALLQVPETAHPQPAGAIDRALAFLRSQVNEDGALGYRDSSMLEYPVYATAYAISCLAHAQRGDEALIARMAAWLTGMQYRDANGFTPRSPAYGGWGFGARNLPPGDPGYMDLSHTRKALQALRAAAAGDDKLRNRALSLLALAQKQPEERGRQPVLPGHEESAGKVPFDGGFYFSPAVPAASKGRISPPTEDHAAYLRSYATATCDGVLALRAAGAELDDPRVRAAATWLTRYPRLDAPHGMPENDPTPWHRALFYYHLSVRAEALDALGADGWQDKLATEVAKHRGPDGSFRNNASALMKEDDPLLATALAVTALAHALR